MMKDINLQTLLAFSIFFFLGDFGEVRSEVFSSRGKDTFCKIVTNTKKIQIPECPTAFNPSILDTEHGLILTFRYCPYPKEMWLSEIGIVFLNSDFEVISNVHFIKTRLKGFSNIPSQCEDARIFIADGKMYLNYNDNIETINPTIKGRRDMYIAELSYEDGEFYLSVPTKVIHETKYEKVLWQKNWVPFEWNGLIHFGYTINPHEILSFSADGLCSSLYVTPLNPYWWKWGTLRGGTPALLVDGEYLAFFHSAIMKKSYWSLGEYLWHYYMGAYTFESEPPFRISKMNINPILGENFYSFSKVDKRVIFPGGFILRGSDIFVVYGKDDSEMWVAKIDKDLLMKSLKPIRKLF